LAEYAIALRHHKILTSKTNLLSKEWDNFAQKILKKERNYNKNVYSDLFYPKNGFVTYLSPL